MLIVSSSKFKLERVFRFATKGIWFVIPMVISIFSVFIAIVLYFPFQSQINEQKSKDVPLEVISLEKIGQGAFSLTRDSGGSILPDMTREIQLLAKNLRPGTRGEKNDFLLLLKSSKEQYKAKSGEQIFLSCDPTVSGAIPVYHFSEKKTPLWIKPVFLD